MAKQPTSATTQPQTRSYGPEPAIASPGEYADQAEDARAETLDPEFEELKATYGTVYTIEGQNEKGFDVKMYLRKPDHNVRKNALAAIMGGKSAEDIIALSYAGEIVLGSCYIGGYNLLADDETRLEASIQAASLVNMNSSFQLKKS